MWAGCGGSESGSSTGPDASMPDSGFQSNCGHPGDKGNSLGVGLFCESVSDCVANPQATLCTTLGSTDNFFCTFACQQAGPPDQCGENASCQCSTGGCGCFPDACGTPDTDGGKG
jgi:hypothetical protein